MLLLLIRHEKASFRPQAIAYDSLVRTVILFERENDLIEAAMLFWVIVWREIVSA